MHDLRETMGRGGLVWFGSAPSSDSTTDGMGGGGDADNRYRLNAAFVGFGDAEEEEGPPRPLKNNI